MTATTTPDHRRKRKEEYTLASPSLGARVFSVWGALKKSCGSLEKGMTAMSIRKVNDVLQHVKYKPAEKMVLVVMADVADENGYCFPGIEYIRETACISRRTAISILQRMDKRGDIYTHRKLGKHNRYIIMANTSKENFVAAATEKLGMDEAQAVEAFLHVQTLAQGGANIAPAAGGAEIAPVETTSENGCKIYTGEEIAPVQELCTTPVQTVAPDPSITVNNNGKKQEPFTFSKERWGTFLQEAQLQMSKPAFQTYVATAEFEWVDESGDRPIVVIRAKDQYAADWLNRQGGLSLLLSHLGGKPAQLYARPKY
jgi:hypothetical protein